MAQNMASTLPLFLAKLETQFLHHLTSSTTTSAPCTTDESVDSINTNSALNNTANNVIDENRMLESSNSDQMEVRKIRIIF